jgi:hypothetical protein
MACVAESAGGASPESRESAASSGPMPDCPPGLDPWRETIEGPMPLLVPEPQLASWRAKYPKLWIEILPPDIPLSGRALMPADLGWA